MPSRSTVRLLAVEPDLGRFLSAEDRAEAAALSVPVSELGNGPIQVDQLLQEQGAFGAVVLKGMVLHRLRVGEQTALRLLGPGDVLSLSGAAPSLLVSSGWMVGAPTRLALLGRDVLMAAHRWPRLVAGLYVRLDEQSERLGTQLAICQLPRVDQRLLALMWLLAESWGQVTSHGTRLPVSLTHDALGGLIGARRPTVTLALRDLSDRGAIVRQDEGWLLLEAPPEPTEADEAPGPSLLEKAGSAWVDVTAPEPEGERTYDELKEVVRRMREEYVHSEERFRERIQRMSQIREQASWSRRRIANRNLSRRPRAPS